MMPRRLLTATMTITLAAALTAFIGRPAMAAPPGTSCTYQGLLTSGGTPVNSNVSVTFRLFDDAVAGSQVGSDIVKSVTPVDGVFSESLDFGVNAWTTNQAMWLEIEVDGDLLGRQKMEGSPYALNTRGITVDAGGRVGVGGGSTFWPLTVDAAGDGFVQINGPENVVVGSYAGGNMGWYGTYSNHPLGFFVNYGAVPAMTIGTNENVGIGTQSPTEKLHVVGNSLFDNGVLVDDSATWIDEDVRIADTDAQVAMYSDESGGSSGNFAMKTVNGSGLLVDVWEMTKAFDSLQFRYGTSAQAGNNPTIMTLHDNGFVGIGTTSPISPLHVKTSGPWAAAGRFESDNGSGLMGVTHNRGGGYPHGVLGWSTTTNPQTFAVGVMGQADNTGGYDFLATGTGQDYGSLSSIRWKHNVEPIDQPLDKLSRIRGVYFDWDQEHGEKHDLGMIAEEVGAVLPEIVNYEANGVDAIAMDYSKLAPLLVEAIKEQQKQIEAQDTRIAALESRLDSTSTAPLLKSSLGWPAIGLLGVGVFALARRRKATATGAV